MSVVIIVFMVCPFLMVFLNHVSIFPISALLAVNDRLTSSAHASSVDPERRGSSYPNV